MLSQKHLKDVCLVNDNTYQKCRYLTHDDNDYTKHYCAKKSSRKKEMDVEINDFIRDSMRRGKDPKKDNIPLGDNCQGYPVLRYIEQGYDKDKP
jgi:hypothetical protein